MSRITISMSESTEKIIQKIIDSPLTHSRTKTDVVRSSIILYYTLIKEIEEGGGIGIIDEENNVKKHVICPFY